MNKILHNKKSIYKLVSIILLVVVVFFVNQYVVGHDFIRELAARFGYIGVFLAASISGFNIVVPIPIITFLPLFVDSGLHATTLILIIAVGMTVGDSVGFWLGKVGREILSEKSQKLSKKIKAMPPLVAYCFLFFYAAFAPLPNEIIVIPMAILGFKFRYMFIGLLTGNIAFNILAGNGILTLFKFL